MTLFEALTGGAFDRLNWNIVVNLTKIFRKSQMPGGLPGGGHGRFWNWPVRYLKRKVLHKQGGSWRAIHPNRCALRLRVVILVVHGVGFSVLFTFFQCTRALLQNFICNKTNQRSTPSGVFEERVGWGRYGPFYKMFKKICSVIHDEHAYSSSVTS